MSQASEPASLSAALRWRGQDGQPEELELHAGDTALLGREGDNSVALGSPRVSRQHAVITWRAGAFEIKDLGSTNGTRVNGVRIAQPTPLRDGDALKLGDVEMEFRLLRPAAVRTAPDPNVKRTIVVAADAPRPRLLVTAGPQEGLHVRLHAGKMVIGRATARESFDIALQDRAVSRPHAAIEQQGEGYVIADLGSANGTLVNGEEIAGPTALRDGDVLLIGETTVLFRWS